MIFTNIIRSYENCEEIALYDSNFDLVIYHSTNIHSSESAISGTVATPYVCRTPWATLNNSDLDHILHKGRFSICN